ncbi:MAG: hypothetical protein H6974_11790 [Gammaproteobacteria bacterium]|nr:hypothetical protein [Gammaproteobacteria bacterium]
MSSVIELYSASGELVRYRPLSARIRDFLGPYSPDQGYAVTTEMVDTLSLKPGLMRLYEAALQAGRKPEELGLPALDLTSQTGVCRAVLTDAHGRVVATATAAKLIAQYKDLEILETAARQRLLAALGYGGEVLNEDEARDQRDQDLTPASGDAEPDDGTVGLADPASPGPPASTQDAAERETSAPAPPRRAVAQPQSVPASPTASGTEAALGMLNRQIQHQAGLKGVTVTPATSVAEARATLKQLIGSAAA